MLQVAVLNNCCDVQEELLTPVESQIAFTCQRYTVPEASAVIVKLLVLTVSIVQAPYDL